MKNEQVYARDINTMNCSFTINIASRKCSSSNNLRNTTRAPDSLGHYDRGKRATNFDRVCRNFFGLGFTRLLLWLTNTSTPITQQ